MGFTQLKRGPEDHTRKVAVSTLGSFVCIMNSDILWYQDGQGDYLGIEVAES